MTEFLTIASKDCKHPCESLTCLTENKNQVFIAIPNYHIWIKSETIQPDELC